ncbi:MAG: Rrf2 family transcriptional regulator [Phycisphaerales bacterium]|nr:MAG: Rrf2 family transcriptional regulator [Phycisphaerales bacterium]
MKLNQDFGMAVETVQFLGQRKTADYIQAAEIAKTLKFSVGYLQKVIQTLSKHGVVECKRGRIGGVRIRAKTVTLLDLWKVTCGELNYADPPLTIMKGPLKAFSDAMGKIVIHKKK